jgi:hypothetical protein
MTEHELRGFAHLADTVRALASPSWHRAVADAATLEDYGARLLATGLPEARIKRVMTQELSRSGPMAMEDRCRNALARLLQGPPHDGTNRRFEAMVAAWTGKYPERSDGDARAALLSLYDSGIFTPEATEAMRESDRFDDE